MKVNVFIFAVAMATIALFASSALVPSSDALDLSKAGPRLITGDVTEDMEFLEGEEAEMLGDVVLSEGVTLTFRAGSTLVIDAMDGMSLTGAAGSGFEFYGGAIVSVAGQDSVMEEDVAVGIDGKIAFAVESLAIQSKSVVGKVSLTADKGTTVSINSSRMAFEDGFAATASVNGTMSGKPDLLDMLGGNLGGMSLDIDADFRTGKVLLTSDGFEGTVEGATSVHAQVQEATAVGTGVDVEWRSAYALYHGSERLDRSSEGDLDLRFSPSGRIVAVNGAIDARIDCDEFSQERLSIIGLHGKTSSVIVDGAASSDFAFDVKGFSVETADGTLLCTAKDVSLEGKLGISIPPSTERFPSFKDGSGMPSSVDSFIRLLEDMKLNLTADLSAGYIFFDFEERGNWASALALGISASTDIDSANGFAVGLSMKAEALDIWDETDQDTADVSVKGIDLSVAYKDVLDVELSAGPASVKDISSGSGYSVSSDRVTVRSVIDGNDISADLSGDVIYKRFKDYAEASMFDISGARAEVDMDIDRYLEHGEYGLQSFAGDVVFSYDNIALDCGRMTYDPKTGMFFSKEAKVSGKSVDVYSDLDSVEGRITDLYVGRGQECSFGHHELTYAMKDGSVLTDTMDISSDSVSEKITVAGTVQYVVANGYSSVTAMQTRSATEGKIIDLSVSGDGRLVMSTFDDGFRLSDGKVHVNGILWTDELRVNAYGLAGADLVIDGLDGVMSIAAEPGYTLDPSTYDGFFVVDGRLVFDESKIVDGSLTLAAESVPDRYKLTLDGVASEVDYGSLVTCEVASDILWFEDSEGTVYGGIEEGVWKYGYGFLGDLALKSVKGSEVPVEPGKVVKSPSDSFFFTISDSGQSAAVSTPSGLMFVIDPHLEAGKRIAASVSKAEYDGYRAYDIKADGRVHVLFPVEDEGTTLFHVVNGIPVEMAGHYVIGDEDEMYLDTHLSSYSVYYLSEKVPEKESTSYLPLICLAAVVAAVAIAAMAYMLKRSRGARGS